MSFFLLDALHRDHKVIFQCYQKFTFIFPEVLVKQTKSKEEKQLHGGVL